MVMTLTPLLGSAIATKSQVFMDTVWLEETVIFIISEHRDILTMIHGPDMIQDLDKSDR